jgi:hypothetical protein
MLFDNYETAHRWRIECCQQHNLPPDQFFLVTRLRVPMMSVVRIEQAEAYARVRWDNDGVIMDRIIQFIGLSVRNGATHVSWHDIPLGSVVKYDQRQTE